MKSKISLIILILFVGVGWGSVGVIYVAPAPVDPDSLLVFAQKSQVGAQDGTAVGDWDTDPTAFQPVGGSLSGNVNLDAWNVAGSPSFPSWQGSVAAATGNFSSQNGNGFSIVLHVESSTKFKLPTTRFTLESSNPLLIPNQNYLFSGSHALSYPFATGVDWGADNIDGTGDEVNRTSQNSLQSFFVNELTLVISPIYLNASSFSGATQQEQLDALMRSFNTPVTLNFSFSSETGAFSTISQSVTITNIPEPNPLGMLAGSLVLVLGFQRFRRRCAV